MKTATTLLLALTFTVMFSSTSFADWKKVNKSKYETDYVDFERIIKHDEFVYYWVLQDYLKPTETGTLSVKSYNQGDCKVFRFKGLSGSFHKEPMGGGIGLTFNHKNLEWIYPPPKSNIEIILKSVCSR